MSVDFIFATFMVLIMVGVMSNLVSDRFNMVDESKELIDSRSLAESIAGSINQVYAGGNGHYIKISTPPEIGKNSNYCIMVNSSGVLVRLEGRRGMAYMIPELISNSPTSLKSSNIILFPARDYIILNKQDGNGENWIVIINE
ncbi:MAG: hypothetical protein LLF83_07475 [Methanobacterium sp.]|nr:hypothetical protein [Methanobacterium sp.]